jgi:hypothetical protein
MRYLARILLITLSLSLALGGLEFLMRKVPGLIPLPVFYQLPGGGRYLQPLVFDEPPIATGFRYQPLIDLPFAFNPDDPSILGGQAAYIAAPAEQGVLQLHLQTDEEGFINPRPAAGEPYDIVVTGDSFLGLSSEEHWIPLLAEASGKRVRNLGMPGWGPQAEAAALAQYALPNQPEWMLLAYFEGNDLWDAMVYEQHRASGLRWDAYDLQGSRFLDRLVLPAFVEWQLDKMARGRENADQIQTRYPLRAEIDGHVLDLVFADLYVRRLSAGRADIEASLNLGYSVDAIASAADVAHQAGIEFGLVYIPSEPSVYLPLLTDDEALRRAVGAVQAEARTEDGWLQPIGEAPLSLKRLRSTLGDQAGVMADFAEANNIPFIDLSSAFRAEAAKGTLLYNHVDTHWNDAGQALAAKTVADALVRLSDRE